MSDLVLGFDAHLEAVDRESARLVTLADRIGAAPVPSCPEWTGLDLVEHVGMVLSFWTGQLRAADVVGPHELDRPPIGSEADPAEWLHEHAAAILAALGELGADSPCWNWSGEAFDSGWVARRMGLELAVHRYDGELAAAETTPVPSALAADGLDERILVHLRVDAPEQPDATLGGSLGFQATDAPAAFVVEVSGGRLNVREGRAPASAYLRGTASDLFLFSWNRVGLDHLEVTGDRSVAAAWSTLPV
jgi:uncharacterized protein (TIGR03083 family)